MLNPQVTYSPAYTLVPTHECFNRCSYCNFRVDLGSQGWLPIAQAEAQLRSLPPTTCEVLILSGEVHPNSPQRSAWLQHIHQLCQLAFDLGFLPHTNVGPLSRQEMQQLKAVNVSMGLMLEQMTPNLLQTVHCHAPSKDPELRYQQLIQAGELKIPFTTGILLGLGEQADDRIASLEAIAQIHAQYGHIQECILQPYSPGMSETWMGQGFPLEALPELVHTARSILPEEITLQIPPNLVHQPEILLACLEAGARDLGGLSLIDEVNPDYPHPTPSQLRSCLEPAGWQLVSRLPIYPQYDRWLLPKLQTVVTRWRLACDGSWPIWGFPVS